jgi:hypothetical protein
MISTSFRDELCKIAVEKNKKSKEWSREIGRIYDPAVVAHEAGHVRLHKKLPWLPAVRGIGRGAAVFGPITYLLASKDPKAGPMAAFALGHVPTLVDEAYASIKGMKELERSGKYSKEELSEMRKKMLAAFGTYTIAPATAVASSLSLASEIKPGSAVGKVVSLAAPIVGAVAGSILSERLQRGGSPAVAKREAKEIAQKIAPGVDIYATDVPVVQGSFAVPKMPKELRKITEMELSTVLEDKKDRKRLARRGGIVIAPLRPVPRGKRVI